MDRNSIIGLLLIGLVLVTFSLWNAPSSEELAERQRVQDSVEVANKKQQAKAVSAAKDSVVAPPLVLSVDSTVSTDSAKSLALQNRFGQFASAAEGKEELSYLENDDLKVTFTNKGGRVIAVQLKKYKTFDGKPLVLFESDSTKFAFSFFSQNKDITTSDLYYVKHKEAPGAITYRLYAGTSYIEHVYKLANAGYMLDFNMAFSGMEKVIAPNLNFIALDWQQNVYKKEKSQEAEANNSTVYFKYPDEEADYLSETSDEQQDLTTKVKWVSFKQQYFNTTLIAKSTFEKPTKLSVVHYEGYDSLAKFMKAGITLPYSHKPYETFDMSFYFGPNHYQTLKSYELGMEKLVPLGWGIFGWVNKFIVIPIFNFLNQFDLNYGIIILILTIAIKLMLLPLTYKAYISTAKMKVLKPEMEEIQAKHKDDPMKSQQELLGMYRKAGVNPLGGCLPMLLQMPILIAMFRFFPASIELRQEAFLWADDLSTYDSILDLPFYIPFYGDHVSLFTILMTVSTIIYTHMNMQMTAQNAQMKWIMYLMPVMFLGIFNNFSSGLSYYYFLANVISFGQQYLFRLAVNEKAIHAKIQENKKRPQAQTKSKFQQKLEQMAKERGIKPPKR
ncbi:MAG: membrane protein insertase YidC [Bacteroidota bacterium]|jgi:YidC/Oxa1 family membrane protein insertase